MNCENCKVYKLDLKKKCSRCFEVRYCSKDCQIQHWKKHKLSCILKTKQNHLDKHEGEVMTGDTISGVTVATDDMIDQHEHTGSGVEFDNDTTKKDAINKKYQHEDADVKVKNNTVDDIDGCGPVKNDNVIRCATCQTVSGCRKCTNCKVVSYCSIECQTNDWDKHKAGCKKIKKTVNRRYVLDEEKRLERVQKEAEQDLMKHTNVLHHLTNVYDERFLRILPPAIRPPGSLDSAKVVASKLYPEAVITDDLDDIPHEHLKSMLSHKVANILVAFIFKYHGKRRRDGVYLQDKDDAVTRVEFHLDQLKDDPMPNFTYDDVKPGNYICLKNPYIHNFDNGTVGIRMDDPSDVKVIQV